jgi:hypothetical protein
MLLFFLSSSGKTILTQLSQLGGEAAFFEDILAYSFSISHKKLPNPAW